MKRKEKYNRLVNILMSSYSTNNLKKFNHYVRENGVYVFRDDEPLFYEHSWSTFMREVIKHFGIIIKEPFGSLVNSHKTSGLIDILINSFRTNNSKRLYLQISGDSYGYPRYIYDKEYNIIKKLDYSDRECEYLLSGFNLQLNSHTGLFTSEFKDNQMEDGVK